MAKKLDPGLLEILTKYGERPEDALWDCHGTWVAYHKAIERIAAKAGIVFDMPQIIEANTAAKTATIAVRGVMGERAEWSFGEASPANNKNAYPFAMAEKRAKDRVVIKLVGLSGIYSEEEADDFKPKERGVFVEANKPQIIENPTREQSFPLREGWEYVTGDPQAKSSAQLKREGGFEAFNSELYDCRTLRELQRFESKWSAAARENGWPTPWKHTACDRIEGHEKAILNAMDAAELAEVPLDKALKHSVGDDFPGDVDTNKYVQNYRAG